MHIRNDFDAIFDKCFINVYQYAFLVAGNGTAAEEITMQTFLYFGAEPAAEDETNFDIISSLLSFAKKTTDDYFYRGMRRIKSKEAVASSVTFPVSNELYSLLKKPRAEKEAYYLSHVRGFTTEETGGHGSLIELIQPDDEIKARLHDDIYFRFEERSVSVENKLRDLRLWFDRHIFLLAVVIVIFFVLCAYFAR